MLKKIYSILTKISDNPREAARVLIATVRGQYAKNIYKLIKPNVIIGKKFRLYSRFYIKGPGKIVIGDNVSVDITFLRYTNILTHTKESIVSIGAGSYLGGVRISCVDFVTIGEEALLGSATIIDSDIIPHKSMHLNNEWKKKHVKPITIGSHFWAGTNSFVLLGSQIGAECVLGAGSVIFNKEIPDYSLMVGNPARRVGATNV